MLPNLLIIGAPKCGTTALHRYLGLHPEVFMSRPKELNFFIEGANWGRGIAWYESHFGEELMTESTRVVGESSPGYANYPRDSGVPARAYSVLPDAKLIFMVRDPVERLLSHYRLERFRSRGRRTLTNAALRNFRNPYVWQSMYWMQLREFLQYYPLSRVLIVAQEDLYRERRSTLRRVFRWLGIDESFDHPGFDQLQRTSTQLERGAFGANALPEPRLEPDQRRRLIEHVRVDSAELRSHTGLRCEHWCV
jgi:hypothetical protein